MPASIFPLQLLLNMYKLISRNPTFKAMKPKIAKAWTALISSEINNVGKIMKTGRSISVKQFKINANFAN